MAYIPPHKRHTNDSKRPLPTPYPMHSIYRWWIVGLADDDQFPASVRLEPVSSESVKLKRCKKPLTLVHGHPPEEIDKTTGSFGRSPWVSIAEKIQPGLLTFSHNVRNGLKFKDFGKVKSFFLARFGKILFHRSPSVRLDTISQTSAVETALSQVKRSFYTNIPSSYMESILSGVIPKIGVDFVKEREYYDLMVSDESQPDETLVFRCNVMEMDEKIELDKIKTMSTRNLVVDTLCLDKNLDLRLDLLSGRMMKSLTDNDMHDIRNLISSAIVDPDVKGGLRWPLGKESSGGRFSVYSIWQYKTKTFKNSSIKLKLRDADRFHYHTSTGDVAKEVILHMTGINAQLQDQIVDIDSFTKMLQDTLKMIWDHFLSCGDHSFP